MSQQKRKLIGIPGFLNSDKMFGVTGNYMEFASRINGGSDVRIIMPHEEFVEVDLLLLPGGLDLSPTNYKRVPGYQNTNHDVFKEFFFRERLNNYVEAKTPIFGICLGFQMLNVHFGGTLTQHLISHEQSSGRWQTAHEVFVPMWKEKNKKETPKLKVNSHHHQAVTQPDLAEDLEIMAYATDREPEGIIIEAFMHKTLSIAGVQFHPEELHDPLSKQLIDAIMK